MTHVPPPQATGRQSSTAAGLGGLALGALVAVAVAALFLGLVGTSRRGRLTPPEHHRAVANPGLRRNPAIPSPSPAAPVLVLAPCTTRQPGPLGFRLSALGDGLGRGRRHARTVFCPAASGAGLRLGVLTLRLSLEASSEVHR